MYILYASLSHLPAHHMTHAPVFFQAPHRAMFFGGAIQAVLSMLWWLTILVLRVTGLASPELVLPPSWFHGLLMVYGFFPFFIFGFAMTAGPRWQGYGEVNNRVYVPAFVALAVGWILFYLGLFYSAFLAPGLALVLTGWLIVLAELIKIVRHPAPDRMHIATVALAVTSGTLGVAAFLAFFSGGPVWLAKAALTIGVWWLLLPVYFSVCHRMIPFFSASVLKGYKVIRPVWAFWIVVIASFAHGALSLANLSAWLWMADIPMALCAFWLSHVWQWRRSLEVRILAMLHIGFLWLGFSLLLYSVQSIALLLGANILGLAPLHALVIGFFATTLIGMVSRVSMGHSGRPVAADQLLWWLSLAIQVVALTRLAADVFTAAWTVFVLSAAVAWLVVFGVWVTRFAPFYWRPRIDGKEG